MKKISRLTAFVLALLMLLQTAAFAEGGVLLDDFDYSSYEGMLMSALDKRGPLVNEGGTLTDAATYLPEQKDLPVYESTEYQGLNVTTAGNEETVQVSLPEKGMVQLSVAAEGGHWQVQVLDQWVDIAGETGATCNVTYAKVKNLFEIGSEAKIRWISADGERASAIASIALVSAEMPAVQALQEQEAIVYDAANDASDTGNASGSVRHTYNIIIRYVFENGETAADPYTANIAAGSAFSANVTFPTVLGYLPYVEEIQQNSIQLNYTDMAADHTITVVYKPTDVEYTVIHYQQNLENDEYTEVKRETRYGLTKSQVPKVEATYEGFYNLQYEQPEIAANGSTVIEIYYDRYYYLLNFDLGGGYGVSPVYARYGAAIGEVGTPVKAGYTFTGWNTTIPKNMPAENITCKASWKANDTAKVTIVVWGENADDEKYSYYKNAEIMAKTEEKLTLADLQGTLICGKEEHTHTSACGINCGHTHTLSCYRLKATASSTSPNSKTALWCDSEPETYFEQLGLEDGYLYYDDENARYASKDNYYLRLDGKYYELKENQFNKLKGTEVGRTSDNTSSNPDYYYKYSIKTSGMSCKHTHTDACYACGKEAHTHTSACYFNASFMENPNLWKLVKSDEVTVAADGTTIMNVYYDRVEFTLHFRKANSNSDNYGTIKAKWGAKIREQWAQKCDTAGTSNWSEKKGAAGPWTSYLDIMPQKDMTFYANTDGSGTSTAYYYVEGLDGKDELFYKNVSTGTGYTVTVEEFIDIDGFTFNASRSTGVGARFDGAKFYYTRNSYNLDFYNYNAVVEGKSQSVKYEAPLNGYDFTPAYPADLEPNAYKFDGWYTTAGRFAGSEADLSTMTMPANDLILYAKWTPVIHKVEFHLTVNHTGIYTPEGAAQAYFEVAHGGNIAKEYVEGHLTKEKMNEAKDNGDYSFVTWYYYETDTDKVKDGKQYFDPTMPIRRDLKLYGEWKSDTLKQYTVRYVLKGTATKVADDLTGQALAGTTKTFDAKGGTDLYPDYQEGYFPTAKSQSMVIDIAEDELVLTFEYVEMPAVPYTVKYINTETGTSVFDGVTVEDKVVSDNKKAVVTETFKPIQGYMPDAYQKRLVVTADGENVLIFYYTKDSEHAYYRITHYTENLATDAQGNPTWTEYASSEAKGDIGTTYTGEPMNIPGFTYNAGISKSSGELTAKGLELKLYYTRNEYPYQVRYLEQGSGKQLHDPQDALGKYGQVISEAAIDIQDYELVSTTPASLNIRIETETDDDGKLIAKLNVITFYYKEKEATINYIPVGPEGLNTDGTPNPTEAGTVTPVSETVKILSGMAVGSTATASSTTYRFVGWYDNAACTGNPLSTDERYMPTRPGSTLGDDGITTGGKWPETGVTYYAKFERALGNLTITKTGCSDLDPNQSFVFTVRGGGQTIEVVIHGNGSVTIKDLPCGMYTVAENTNWSWRYDVVDTEGRAEQFVPVNGPDASVTFTNSRTRDKWLDGNAYCDNNWGTKTATKSN